MDRFAELCTGGDVLCTMQHTSGFVKGTSLPDLRSGNHRNWLQSKIATLWIE